MGVYAVRFPHVPLRVPFSEWRLPAVAAITAWGIITFVLAVASAVIQVVGRVSHWAHVGGFVFGLGVAQLMGLHLHARREELAAAADRAAADGDFATASAAWSALLAIDPANVEIRDALVHARVALGDAIGAERLAREGIEQAARSGHREVALFAYQSFHTVLPDLRLAPGVRCRIGNWWVDEGQFVAAYDTMLRAADEEAGTPAAATALYRAGEIAADKLEDSRRARTAWQRVLLDYPDSPWRDTVHQRLRTLGAARPQR
jgi:tetratricopeptide (TPR) repeat protein